MAQPRTNQRMQSCSNCGQVCQPGQGRLVHYSQYDIDDGMAPCDAEPGWHVYCLDAQACRERVSAARAAADKARRHEAEIQARKRELFNPASGEMPRAADGGPVIVSGTTIPWRGGFNIHGGGEQFVLTGQHVWHVRNNGADGDDWSRNNVQTGGAGAIGYRFPVTAERVAFLREHCPESTWETPCDEYCEEIPDRDLQVPFSTGLLGWNGLLSVDPEFRPAAEEFCRQFSVIQREHGRYYRVPQSRFRAFYLPYQKVVEERIDAIGGTLTLVGLSGRLVVVAPETVDRHALEPLNLQMRHFVARVTPRHCLFRDPETDAVALVDTTYRGGELPNLRESVANMLRQILAEGVGGTAGELAMRLLNDGLSVETGTSESHEDGRITHYHVTWRDGSRSDVAWLFGGGMSAGGDGDTWSWFVDETPLPHAAAR